MATDWYYAQNNEQRGPVGSLDLLALEREGLLLPGTLVWRAGLAAWQPWSTVAPDVRAEAGSQPGSAEEVAVCAFSGSVLPVSQMVKYGERFVAVEHKDAFVQSLREGGRVQAMGGAVEIQPVGFWWRVLSLIIDGLVLMVPNMLLMAPYIYFAVENSMSQMRAGPPPSPLAQYQNMSSAMVVSYVVGSLGTILVMLVYETWMGGRFGGTVGKLALGFKILKVNGERLTYGRAFGRWAAKLLESLIWGIPANIALAVGFASQVAAAKVSGPQAGVSPGFIIGMISCLIWLVVGGFGYYMAGWTRRKQALHDKICKTLVVRKTPQ